MLSNIGVILVSSVLISGFFIIYNAFLDLKIRNQSIKKIIYNLINPEYINISNLPKGQYLLRIKSEKGITNERLLKI